MKKKCNADYCNLFGKVDFGIVGPSTVCDYMVVFPKLRSIKIPYTLDHCALHITGLCRTDLLHHQKRSDSLNTILFPTPIG